MRKADLAYSQTNSLYPDLVVQRVSGVDERLLDRVGEGFKAGYCGLGGSVGGVEVRVGVGDEWEQRRGEGILSVVRSKAVRWISSVCFVEGEMSYRHTVVYDRAWSAELGSGLLEYAGDAAGVAEVGLDRQGCGVVVLLSDCTCCGCDFPSCVGEFACCG